MDVPLPLLPGMAPKLGPPTADRASRILPGTHKIENLHFLLNSEVFRVAVH